MSGQVLEIKNLIDRDALAGEISSKWSDWNLQRKEKTDEIKELRDYIFATDTRTTSVGKNTSWKNSTTLPKLTQIRDNLHANYRSALFSNDEWLKWEGYSAEDVTKDKANTIEEYMKNKLRESGFEQTVDKLLYDYIDTGNVFGEVIFVKEKTVDHTTGETIPGYIGPRLIRNSIYDTVFNPTARSYQESPKISRYIKTIGELKAEASSRPELKYNIEVIAKLESTRSALGGMRTDDIDKSDAYIVDGFGSLSQYYQSEFVEILEFEGTIHDMDTGELLENYLITVIDRNWVVRKEPNPSWLGKSPRAHVGWRERPDNLYAMGPLDNLVGMQYRLDHLENLKADALDLTIHPPVKIIGDVESFTWSPEAQIRIPDADGDVVPMPPNAAAFQVNNEIAYLQAQMEEMAGAPKEAMGVRTPGEKTAFEVQQLQNAAGRLFQDKISKFEKYFLEPIINTMFEVARRNMDGADLIRVMDDDLGVAEFIQVTKEDITASGKLRPLGARHFAAQAQFMQNMQGIFNSGIGQMIAPHVSSIRLAKIVEETFGLEKFDLIQENIAILEQMQTQRLANQAQENLEVEAMTPTEEEL